MRDKVIIIVLAIIVVLLCYKGCEVVRDRNELLTQVSNYQIGEKEFKSRILKDSSTIATQSQTLLTQEEAIKLGLLKLEGDIKKVQSQVRQIQNIGLDSVFVPFIPSNYVDSSDWILKYKQGDKSSATIDSLVAHSIVVPKPFELENKWYSIEGKVKKDGVLLDSLNIRNESSVTIGFKKSGFLNLKREPIVEIKNTNPYLEVSKVNNVVVKQKNGILQSKLFWMGVGILGGIFLHSKL
jgi:hypothetical protein